MLRTPLSFFHPQDRPVRVGVSGTGFIARGLLGLLANHDSYTISKVLSRRKPEDVDEIDSDLLTQSPEELAECSDLVVECSGSVVWGAKVVEAAFAAGRPVVTMSTEFHVTVGSYYCEQGILSEAEGDQPGSLAALGEEARSMGFHPLVYGNIKGFLNHTPHPDEMEYWANKNGISVAQTTSFTDGTKIQMEQALVANGLGATLACRGMLGEGGQPLDLVGASLGRRAKRLGRAISDYTLNRELPAGVFIVAEHTFERPEVLRYFKLGDGPFFTLTRPYHLCHLEMLRTIHRVACGGGPLLNNSPDPTVTVASVAKRDIRPGTYIDKAPGCFDLRGEASLISEVPDAIPLGLIENARIVRHVERGQTLTWDDVELPETEALKAAKELRKRSQTSGEDRSLLQSCIQYGATGLAHAIMFASETAQVLISAA
ncbi:MAG: NAD(P)-dependent oxidoreductase [Verrucomicrobiaceae bacterium]|nr:NAD(P)-dependent oxidoreductase [Verrucomicrobiaceae bacterium]